jgi:hypothetical protein
MELTGRIIAVLEAKSGTSSKTGNPWMMQGYVIEVPGQYPRRCAFTVFGEDRIKQLNIQNGEDLTVLFDIDAREYNGRWYNDIRAYNVIRENDVSLTESSKKTTSDESVPPFPPMPEMGDTFKDVDGSRLPF